MGVGGGRFIEFICLLQQTTIFDFHSTLCSILQRESSHVLVAVTRWKCLLQFHRLSLQSLNDAALKNQWNLSCFSQLQQGTNLFILHFYLLSFFLPFSPPRYFSSLLSRFKWISSRARKGVTLLTYFDISMCIPLFQFSSFFYWFVYFPFQSPSILFFSDFSFVSYVGW